MSKESSPSLGDVVSAATFVIAVITAWLYTVGWTYVYQYFIQFRVPLLLIDLPLQHYFVYGGLVLWKNVWISIAVSVAILVLAWACVRFASRLGRFVQWDEPLPSLLRERSSFISIRTTIRPTLG
jgi:hypothetical protein